MNTLSCEQGLKTQSIDRTKRAMLLSVAIATIVTGTCTLLWVHFSKQSDVSRTLAHSLRIVLWLAALNTSWYSLLCIAVSSGQRAGFQWPAAFGNARHRQPPSSLIGWRSSVAALTVPQL